MTNTKPIINTTPTDNTEPAVMNPTDNPPTASVQPAPDPFDLESLRLNPSFTETAGVTKLITTVPARKPNPQDFVRVHPASEYRENFAMIDLKEEREDFLVRRELVPELSSEVVFKTVFTAINRQGTAFLWPVKLIAPEDRQNDWNRSQREAAEMAMLRWIRMQSNRSLGAYEIIVAESEIADPVWPNRTFQELLQTAYRDRIITSIDHPVVKRLRGLP